MGTRDPFPTWQTFRQIQATLHWSDADLANHLEISLPELQRLSTTRTEPSFLSGLRLCEKINVSFDSLISGQIDFQLMAHQYFDQEPAELPERYRLNATGKRRTVMNILDYIRVRAGWKARALVLRQFQLREDHFLDPEAPINNSFIVDLLGFLERLGYTPKDFFEMGAHSVNCNQNSPIADSLKTSNHSREVYERMVGGHLTDCYDQNFTYQLHKFEDEHCTVQIRQREEVAAALKKRHLGSEHQCINKAGVFSTMPVYAGLGPAKVQHTKCTHNGETHCELEISFRNDGRATIGTA